jgi:hypothetical protein
VLTNFDSGVVDKASSYFVYFNTLNIHFFFFVTSSNTATPVVTSFDSGVVNRASSYFVNFNFYCNLYPPLSITKAKCSSTSKIQPKK